MHVLTDVDEARIRALRDHDEFFWLDLHAPTAEGFATVGNLLGLHPIAMEDTREFGQRPKVDAYESHVLVVFFTARRTGSDEPVATPIEVHVYVSGDFVVTVRQEKCDLLDHLHDTLEPQETEVEDYLVYRIFDTLTDAWYPAINAIEDLVDALEAEVFVRARKSQLSRIYRLRQEVRLVDVDLRPLAELARVLHRHRVQPEHLAHAREGLGRRLVQVEPEEVVALQQALDAGPVDVGQYLHVGTRTYPQEGAPSRTEISVARQ